MGSFGVDRIADLLQRDDPNGCHTYDLWSLEWGDDRAESVRETFEEYLRDMDDRDAERWLAAVG